jgi:hypothetical protein
MNSSEAGIGHIEYYFKGRRMKPEPAKVRERLLNDSIVVTRVADGQEIEFVDILGSWLLKTSINQNNPLYGTRFTLSL